MKVKLKERYLPDFYMNRLVNELHNPHKSRQIVSSNDVGEARIVENVSVLSKITSVVEDTSIDSCPSDISRVIENTSVDFCLLPSSLDEFHVSPEDTSDTSNIVDALMESSTLITDEINIHEDNHYS